MALNIQILCFPQMTYQVPLPILAAWWIPCWLVYHWNRVVLVCSFQRTSLYNPYSIILSLFTAALNIIVMSLVSTFLNEFLNFKYNNILKNWCFWKKSKFCGKIEIFREKKSKIWRSNRVVLVCSFQRTSLYSPYSVILSCLQQL